MVKLNSLEEIHYTNQFGSLSLSLKIILLIKSVYYKKGSSRLTSFFILLCITSLCFSPSVWAQQNSKAIRYGNIPDSLFSIDFIKDFPKTDYLILYKETHVDIEDDSRSIIAKSVHQIRIKVLTEKGLQSTIVGVPYLSFMNMEKITDIKGYTFDGKNKTYLDTSFVKTIDINSRVSVKEFQIPEVKIGDIFEYRYSTERRYIEELPEFYFQHEVPVLFAKFSMKEARYLRYNSKIHHKIAPVNYQRIEEDTTTAVKLFTRKYSDPIVTHIWTAKNIPPFNEEPFVLKASDFRMNLSLSWSEFGVPLQIIESNWDLVSAELSKEKGLEYNIQRAEKWKDFGKNVALNKLNQHDIIDSIFTKIQSSASFNNQKTITSKTNPDSLFVQPIQDAATINHALIAALRGAGLSVFPLLATKIHNTELSDIYPTKYLFEQILTVVELKEGKRIILDPTDKYAHINMIPSEYVNQKAFLLRGLKDYTWINLVNSNSVFEQQLWLKAELKEDGKLNGSISGDARGYIARDMREKISKNIDLRDHFKALLFDRYWNVDISNVEVTANAADSVKFNFTFSMDNAGSVTEKGGLAVKPLLVGYLNQNPFENTERNLPIQFKAEERIVLNAYIKLPKKFKANFKRADLNYGFDGAFIQWKEFGGKDIDFRFEVQLSQLDYEPSSYAFIKKIYDTWKNLSDREIIIEK